MSKSSLLLIAASCFFAVSSLIQQANANCNTCSDAELEILSIDDADPMNPKIWFSLGCPFDGCGVEALFNGQRSWVGYLAPGLHSYQISLENVPPGVHQIGLSAFVIDYPTSSEDFVTFDNSRIRRVAATSQSQITALVFNGGGKWLGHAFMTADVMVQDWQWSLPTRYNRRFDNLRLGINTDLKTNPLTRADASVLACYSYSTLGGCLNERQLTPDGSPSISRPGYREGWLGDQVAFGKAGVSRIDVRFSGRSFTPWGNPSWFFLNTRFVRLLID